MLRTYAPRLTNRSSRTPSAVAEIQRKPTVPRFESTSLPCEKVSSPAWRICPVVANGEWDENDRRCSEKCLSRCETAWIVRWSSSRQNFTGHHSAMTTYPSSGKGRQEAVNAAASFSPRARRLHLRQRGDQFSPTVEASRNDPSFAVALNCGIGSRYLNALVNALERLHVVRGANSSTVGLK